MSHQLDSGINIRVTTPGFCIQAESFDAVWHDCGINYSDSGLSHSSAISFGIVELLKRLVCRSNVEIFESF